MNNNFEDIWDDYREKLLAFVRKRTGDVAVAEDIVQDIFVKIFSRLDSLQSDTRLESWIYQIARNTIIDHYRSRKLQISLPETLNPDSETSDTGSLARQEIATCLQPMMHLLPEPYQGALMLADVLGLPQQKVAEIQGVSLTAAKSRIRRGRAMLKDIYLDCCQVVYDRRGSIFDYQKNNCEAC